MSHPVQGDDVLTPDAYIIVPPFIKYISGPLLGPSLLKAECGKRGENVKVIDLNIEYLHHIGVCTDGNIHKHRFLGDHAGQEHLLNAAANHFLSDAYGVIQAHKFQSEGVVRLLKMHLSFEEIEDILDMMDVSYLGRYFREALVRLPRPSQNIFGMSILWSGQVLPALLLSKLIWKVLPSCSIVWGGPYVTALSGELQHDKRYGSHVDAFLPGHCELSLIELLDNMKYGHMAAKGLIVPGRAASHSPAVTSWPDTVLPDFSDELIHWPGCCILPVQISRGCPYGRCVYCTYPNIEGDYRCTSLEMVDSIVELALESNSAISFKDSLIPSSLLRDIGRRIGGRVRWSACTKPNGSLNEEVLGELAENGLHTLEVGLETTDMGILRLIDRDQSAETLFDLLKGAAKRGIHLVVNLITGFPGQDEAAAVNQLEEVQNIIESVPRLNARLEHNTLDVHRLSRMGKNPSGYGIRITMRWPWASTMEWDVVN